MTPTMRMLFALVLVLPALLFCQADLGGIRGVVSDSTGSVVPEANVSATNVATGVATRTLTTGAGVYFVPNLPGLTASK